MSSNYLRNVYIFSNTLAFAEYYYHAHIYIQNEQIYALNEHCIGLANQTS